ncbi:hypothetical protein A1Q1_06172 [Trichosporon asahii var. asahii CBS 2479]|nr:hypothetical protein A1Q1_06172 [Trichosporon asahii var. asahii CBS 2479]EJT45409.1 hypothetical protein A1Q1_06172 [Trichosporon asahii var. asahii CBS 2479]
MAPVKQERNGRQERGDIKSRSKQEQRSRAGQKKTPWSAEEEAIWLSLVQKTLRKHLLPIVRADGRLKHRCISTHLGAMVGRGFGAPLTQQISNMKKKGSL